jgi:hypothetical protein
MKRFSLLLIVICFYLFSCHHNRVSVSVKNASKYDFQRLIVRFGDTLRVIDTLRSGDVAKRFWSNATHGRGFTKVILMNGDTLVYKDYDMVGKKIYYRGKILVRIDIGKDKYDRDTVLIKTRRRILF